MRMIFLSVLVFLGYEFVKLAAGMDSVTRPALYGARHPMVIIPKDPSNHPSEAKPFVIVGHCCETGDLFSQVLLAQNDVSFE